jgi:hypothetical protein
LDSNNFYFQLLKNQNHPLYFIIIQTISLDVQVLT